MDLHLEDLGKGSWYVLDDGRPIARFDSEEGDGLKLAYQFIKRLQDAYRSEFLFRPPDTHDPCARGLPFADVGKFQTGQGIPPAREDPAKP